MSEMVERMKNSGGDMIWRQFIIETTLFFGTAWITSLVLKHFFGPPWWELLN